MWSRRTVLLAAGAAAGCRPRHSARPIALPPPQPTGPGAPLAIAARAQIGVTTGYDGGYRALAYPGGDPPRSTGACTDVLIRAARDAWGVDLQKLVHEDMAAHFGAYPRRWGLKAPNSNIDHRRVPNLETFLTRQGARVWLAELAVWGTRFPGPFETGDILTWRCALSNGPHIAIVVQGGAGGEDVRIVENKGGGVREAPLSVSFEDAAVAQFRWRPVDVSRAGGEDQGHGRIGRQTAGQRRRPEAWKQDQVSISPRFTRLAGAHRAVVAKA